MPVKQIFKIFMFFLGVWRACEGLGGSGRVLGGPECLGGLGMYAGAGMLFFFCF